MSSTSVWDGPACQELKDCKERLLEIEGDLGVNTRVSLDLLLSLYEVREWEEQGLEAEKEKLSRQLAAHQQADTELFSLLRQSQAGDGGARVCGHSLLGRPCGRQEREGPEGGQQPHIHLHWE